MRAVDIRARVSRFGKNPIPDRPARVAALADYAVEGAGWQFEEGIQLLLDEWKMLVVQTRLLASLPRRFAGGLLVRTHITKLQ